MQHRIARSGWPQPRPSVTRRQVVSLGARLAGAAALTATIPALRGVPSAAAKDGDIVLTGAASQLTASPGAASAQGAIAAAAAERGAARVEAAAALAHADDESAVAQGAAATAAAAPDQGAIAQGAIAVTSASSQTGKQKAPAKSSAPSGKGGRGGGRRVTRARGGGGGRGGGRGGRRRQRVATLPATGTGAPHDGPLSTLLAVASGVAALGAAALRRRDDREPTGTPASAAPSGPAFDA